MQHIYGVEQAVVFLCETRDKVIFFHGFQRPQELRKLLLKINSTEFSSMEMLLVYSLEMMRRTRKYEMITAQYLLENYLWCWRKYKRYDLQSKQNCKPNKNVSCSSEVHIWCLLLFKCVFMSSSLADTCEGDGILIWSYL